MQRQLASVTNRCGNSLAAPRHVIGAARKAAAAAAANPYLIKVVRKREGRRPAAAYGSPVVNDASIIGGAQSLIGWLRQDLVPARLLRLMTRQLPREGLRPPASTAHLPRRSIRRAVLMRAATVVAHFYAADLASLWCSRFAIHLASGRNQESGTNYLIRVRLKSRRIDRPASSRAIPLNAFRTSSLLPLPELIIERFSHVETWQNKRARATRTR